MNHDDPFQALFAAAEGEDVTAGPGDIVEATVESVDGLDVNCVVPDGRRFVVLLDERFDEPVSVGTHFDVMLYECDDAGTLAASAALARRARAWERLARASERAATLHGTVTRAIAGGWEIDLDGVLALLPSDQIADARNGIVEPGMRLEVAPIRWDRTRLSASVSERFRWDSSEGIALRARLLPPRAIKNR